MGFLPARASGGWKNPRSGGRLTLAVFASLPASLLLTSAALTNAGAATEVNPPENIPRTAVMAQACSAGPGQGCELAVVEAIDRARAAEEVGPLELPPYYDNLTVPEQLLVLADLERVDRGLPGFEGLSSQLDSLASHGASEDTDPTGPSGVAWGSNWAGGEETALLADYDWMYDDGYGSPNLDCANAHAGGCWDHRENILGNYGPHPAMGAGAAKVGGVTSMTELFSSGPPGRLDFVLPRQAPALVSPTAVQIGTVPAVANTAMLTVSDPGAAFRARAHVAGDKGDWLVTPSCAAGAGRQCHLFVTFMPTVTGPATALVTIDLPGHVEQVNVSAYAGHGYWEATARGQILAFGGGGYRGSAENLHLAKPIVGIVPTSDGGGYWEVAADGGVFSFGDAHFYGSAAGLHEGTDFVGMARSAGGRGYWLATSNGDVYSFGGARRLGSLAGGGGAAGDAGVAGNTGAGNAANQVSAITATPDGRGYWLTTSGGNVYSFGDASYFGPDLPLTVSQPVVGMAATHDGKGYWLVTRSGQVYGFGDAANLGSLEGRVGQDVVGIAAGANGYYVVSSEGQAFFFGGAASGKLVAAEDIDGVAVLGAGVAGDFASLDRSAVVAIASV